MRTDATTSRTVDKRAIAWLVGFLIVAAAIYVPGLNGPLVFDDSTFLIANVAVQVTTLNLADWIAAALSFPSGSHQGRWLGMLSFAVNHYFTGLDPYWLKLTNIGIHLLNGVLVFLMLRALFALRQRVRGNFANETEFDAGMTAATLAGLWLVLPINVTAVLYVSQRLESLSNTFVFLGLFLYLRARLAHWEGERSALGLWVALVVSTGIGVLVKESAVMLPLYALCVELALTGARTRDGSRSRGIIILYSALIGVPLMLGAIWLAGWVGGASSYARPFDTLQRLMTEARVLVDYIQWTLLPQPESLTLYHDDILVSRGLLDPPTTLASIAALVGLLFFGLWQRARRPLFALGVLWFFSGHLLTGTVIPLLLAFEHRNYFPSVGLLLAVASLITLEGGLQRSRIRVALAASVFVFYAFTTWMRAEEWSDPLRLALSEANKRPDSSAAQYDLGRVLLASTRNDAPMTEQGFEVLERASRMPDSDILHEQLLIVAHAHFQRPIKPEWWSSLIAKLRSRPPTTSDIGGLIQLFRCQEEGKCPSEVDNLKAAFEAAVSHPSTNGVLLSLYGEFLEKFLNDPRAAEEQYRAALVLVPDDPRALSNFVVFLVHAGRFEEARSALDKIRARNLFGSRDKKIAELEALLMEAEAAAR
ncbi:MAG: tetratricopeptide repeat protein [Rhodanobacteraceae bacterium]